MNTDAENLPGGQHPQALSPTTRFCFATIATAECLSVYIRTTMNKSFRSLRKFCGKAMPCCSAGFQTCRIADFQSGGGGGCKGVRSAGLETLDTADLEVRATSVAVWPRRVHGGL